MDKSGDKLKQAIITAIVGNIIDMGANPDFDLETEIDNITSGNIILDDYTYFKKDLLKSKTILYIADNYEEAIFDKFLLEALWDKKIIYAVRSVSILNDITLSDANRHRHK